jgi:hypothetical protein
MNRAAGTGYRGRVGCAELLRNSLSAQAVDRQPKRFAGVESMPALAMPEVVTDQPWRSILNKLLASVLVAACSTLAFPAMAATDKSDAPTAAATPHHDKKSKSSHGHKTSTHAKKSTHKSDAKQAGEKPAEASK